MEFLPFPKIATGAGGAKASTAGLWVAQEKIHGAQLVIGVEGGQAFFGKRKAWLADGDAFFGWQLLRRELAAQALAMRDALRLASSDRIYFYGELFGGHYPHASVAAVPGMSPVQTGIWYAPDIRWCPFDAVLQPAGSSVEDAQWVGHAELRAASLAANALSPPVLGRGRKSELHGLAVRFGTKVPTLLGLPELPGNWAEGLVLKPEASTPVHARAVEKRKIEEFDEKRFDESEAWDPHQFVAFDDLQTWAQKLVNPARIASARSKVGDGDVRGLVEEIALDVLIDLGESFPTTMGGLDEEQEARLRERVMECARAAVGGG